MKPGVAQISVDKHRQDLGVHFQQPSANQYFSNFTMHVLKKSSKSRFLHQRLWLRPSSIEFICFDLRSGPIRLLPCARCTHTVHSLVNTFCCTKHIMVCSCSERTLLHATADQRCLHCLSAPLTPASKQQQAISGGSCRCDSVHNVFLKVRTSCCSCCCSCVQHRQCRILVANLLY